MSDKEPDAYQPAEEGPFRCDHCEYYLKGGYCHNKKVVSWAKAKKFGLRLHNSMEAVVEPGACCNEFEKE